MNKVKMNNSKIITSILVIFLVAIMCCAMYIISSNANESKVSAETAGLNGSVEDGYTSIYSGTAITSGGQLQTWLAEDGTSSSPKYAYLANDITISSAVMTSETVQYHYLDGCGHKVTIESKSGAMSSILVESSISSSSEFYYLDSSSSGNTGDSAGIITTYAGDGSGYDRSQAKTPFGASKHTWFGGDNIDKKGFYNAGFLASILAYSEIRNTNFVFTNDFAYSNTLGRGISVGILFGYMFKAKVENCSLDVNGSVGFRLTSNTDNDNTEAFATICLGGYAGVIDKNSYIKNSRISIKDGKFISAYSQAGSGTEYERAFVGGMCGCIVNGSTIVNATATGGGNIRAWVDDDGVNHMSLAGIIAAVNVGEGRASAVYTPASMGSGENGGSKAAAGSIDGVISYWTGIALYTVQNNSYIYGDQENDTFYFGSSRSIINHFFGGIVCGASEDDNVTNVFYAQNATALATQAATRYNVYSPNPTDTAYGIVTVGASNAAPTADYFDLSVDKDTSTTVASGNMKNGITLEWSDTTRSAVPAIVVDATKTTGYVKTQGAIAWSLDVSSTVGTSTTPLLSKNFAEDAKSTENAIVNYRRYVYTHESITRDSSGMTITASASIGYVGEYQLNVAGDEEIALADKAEYDGTASLATPTVYLYTHQVEEPSSGTTYYNANHDAVAISNFVLGTEYFIYKDAAYQSVGTYKTVSGVNVLSLKVAMSGHTTYTNQDIWKAYKDGVMNVSYNINQIKDAGDYDIIVYNENSQSKFDFYDSANKIATYRVDNKHYDKDETFWQPKLTYHIGQKVLSAFTGNKVIGTTSYHYENGWLTFANSVDGWGTADGSQPTSFVYTGTAYNFSFSGLNGFIGTDNYSIPMTYELITYRRIGAEYLENNNKYYVYDEDGNICEYGTAVISGDDRYFVLNTDTTLKFYRATGNTENPYEEANINTFVAETTYYVKDGTNYIAIGEYIGEVATKKHMSIINAYTGFYKRVYTVSTEGVKSAGSYRITINDCEGANYALPTVQREWFITVSPRPINVYFRDLDELIYTTQAQKATWAVATKDRAQQLFDTNHNIIGTALKDAANIVVYNVYDASAINITFDDNSKEFKTAGEYYVTISLASGAAANNYYLSDDLATYFVSEEDETLSNVVRFERDNSGAVIGITRIVTINRAEVGLLRQYTVSNIDDAAYIDKEYGTTYNYYNAITDPIYTATGIDFKGNDEPGYYEIDDYKGFNTLPCVIKGVTDLTNPKFFDLIYCDPVYYPATTGIVYVAATEYESATTYYSDKAGTVIEIADEEAFAAAIAVAPVYKKYTEGYIVDPDAKSVNVISAKGVYVAVLTFDSDSYINYIPESYYIVYEVRGVTATVTVDFTGLEDEFEYNAVDHTAEYKNPEDPTANKIASVDGIVKVDENKGIDINFKYYLMDDTYTGEGSVTVSGHKYVLVETIKGAGSYMVVVAHDNIPANCYQVVYKDKNGDDWAGSTFLGLPSFALTITPITIKVHVEPVEKTYSYGFAFNGSNITYSLLTDKEEDLTAARKAIYLQDKANIVVGFTSAGFAPEAEVKWDSLNNTYSEEQYDVVAAFTGSAAKNYNFVVQEHNTLKINKYVLTYTFTSIEKEYGEYFSFDYRAITLTEAQFNFYRANNTLLTRTDNITYEAAASYLSEDLYFLANDGTQPVSFENATAFGYYKNATQLYKKGVSYTYPAAGDYVLNAEYFLSDNDTQPITINSAALLGYYKAATTLYTRSFPVATEIVEGKNYFLNNDGTGAITIANDTILGYYKAATALYTRAQDGYKYTVATAYDDQATYYTEVSEDVYEVIAIADATAFEAAGTVYLQSEKYVYTAATAYTANTQYYARSGEDPDYVFTAVEIADATEFGYYTAATPVYVETYTAATAYADDTQYYVRSGAGTELDPYVYTAATKDSETIYDYYTTITAIYIKTANDVYNAVGAEEPFDNVAHYYLDNLGEDEVDLTATTYGYYKTATTIYKKVVTPEYHAATGYVANTQYYIETATDVYTAVTISSEKEYGYYDNITTIYKKSGDEFVEATAFTANTQYYLHEHIDYALTKGVVRDGDSIDSLAFSVTRTVGENVYDGTTKAAPTGAYDVEVTATGTRISNYTIEIVGRFTVIKKTLTLNTITAQTDLKYNAAEKAPTVTFNGVYGEDEVIAVITYNDDADVKPINVGTYTIKVTGITGAQKDNYIFVPTSNEQDADPFTITARNVTIVGIEDITMGYGDTKLVPTTGKGYTLDTGSDDFVYDSQDKPVDIVVTFKTIDPATMNETPKTIENCVTLEISGDGAVNYNLTVSATGDLTITAKELATLELKQAEMAYTGSNLKDSIALDTNGSGVGITTYYVLDDTYTGTDSEEYNTHTYKPTEDITIVGDYLVKAVVTDSTYYAGGEEKLLPFNVIKATWLVEDFEDSDITVNFNSITFGGKFAQYKASIRVSLDGTFTDFDADIITGLKANTRYEFYVKILELDNYNESAVMRLSATTTYDPSLINNALDDLGTSFGYSKIVDYRKILQDYNKVADVDKSLVDATKFSAATARYNKLMNAGSKAVTITKQIAGKTANKTYQVAAAASVGSAGIVLAGLSCFFINKKKKQNNVKEEK